MKKAWIKMLYSMAPASVLIINLILNWESIRKYGFCEKKQDEKKRVPLRFNCFVLAAACYDRLIKHLTKILPDADLQQIKCVLGKKV